MPEFSGSPAVDGPPSEIENAALLAASGAQRYAYFLRRVCASGKVWGLHCDGWAILGEGNRRLLPLWPDEAFAEHFRQADLAAYAPKSIELSGFLDQWLPGMKAKGMEVAIFPVGSGDSVFVVLDELEANLRHGLGRD